MTLRLPAYVALALGVLSGVAWLGQQQRGDLTAVVDSARPSVVVDIAPAAAVVPTAPATRVAPAPDPQWVASTAAAAGISQPAVAAYARAVLGQPAGCGLGWTTLAGLGWVESHHATIGGRTLDATGRPSAPIIGPALDGVGPVAAIAASELGRTLHGDPVWDHAVGPMQFLPSTWQTWGRDGDGDGSADPQDLDDAAAAAAAYLCGTGQDLTTGAGWSAAVRAYNHSDAYVLAVHSAATAYAQRTTAPAR